MIQLDPNSETSLADQVRAAAAELAVPAPAGCKQSILAVLEPEVWDWFVRRHGPHHWRTFPTRLVLETPTQQITCLRGEPGCENTVTARAVA